MTEKQEIEDLRLNLGILVRHVMTLESKIKDMAKSNSDLAFRVEALTIIYPDKQGLRESEVLSKLGISVSTFKRWLVSGKIYRVSRGLYALNKDLQPDLLARIRNNAKSDFAISQAPQIHENFSDLV